MKPHILPPSKKKTWTSLIVRYRLPVDDITNSVQEANSDQIVPGHGSGGGQQVAGHQGGQEGEGGVGGDEGPAESGVHSVVGQAEVFLEEQSVSGKHDLKMSDI